MQPNENNNKLYQEIFDTRETTDPNELSKVHVDEILQNLNRLSPPKFISTDKIVNLLKEPKKNVVIDKNENLTFDGPATGKIFPFFSTSCCKQLKK